MIFKVNLLQLFYLNDKDVCVCLCVHVRGEQMI